MSSDEQESGGQTKVISERATSSDSGDESSEGSPSPGPTGPQDSDKEQSTLTSEATSTNQESGQSLSQSDAKAKKEERLKRLRELHLRRVCSKLAYVYCITFYNYCVALVIVLNLETKVTNVGHGP